MKKLTTKNLQKNYSVQNPQKLSGWLRFDCENKKISTISFYFFSSSSVDFYDSFLFAYNLLQHIPYSIKNIYSDNFDTISTCCLSVFDNPLLSFPLSIVNCKIEFLEIISSKIFYQTEENVDNMTRNIKKKIEYLCPNFLDFIE